MPISATEPAREIDGLPPGWASPSPQRLRLDFETYSELNIKQVGAHKYAMHNSTEVLMAAYWIDDEQYFWDATVGPIVAGKFPGAPRRAPRGIPAMLAQALENPDCLIYAFNAQFERLILKHVLGYDIPASRFRCTMVRAYRYSFRGDLHAVGEQLGLPPELLKSKAGKALINKFSKPAPKNHKVDRYTRENSPEKWEEFCEYCRQDVVTEAAVDQALDRYYQELPIEQELYVLDQKINDAGVPVDVQMINAAKEIARQVHNELWDRLQRLTGLNNPNSNKQLIPWLQARGVEVPKKWSSSTKAMAYTLDKTALSTLLDQEHPTDVRTALELKQQLAKTSVTKYKAFSRAEKDGLVRGMFQLRGAQRTGRYAGRVVQLHNLARPKWKDTDTLAGFVKTANAQLLAAMYDDALLALSSATRSTICAPDLLEWNVSDLGSIESRMLGWHTGCERINNIFAQGKDTYRDFATELYEIPYDQVTSEQRNYCKPPTLGCGYRMSGPTMVSYAAGMGVTMTKKEGFRVVRVYRKAFPEVCGMWYWLETAVENAVRYNVPAQGYRVSIWYNPDMDMLCIQLPSGRILYYHQPRIEMVEVTFEKEDGTYKTIEKESLTFMGTDKFAPGLWTRVSAHGGVLTENIIQASAADVLVEWQLRADRAGFDIRLHVHDEIAALERSDRVEEMNDLIRQPIPWAPDLLLDAGGYTAKRYRKD